MKQIPNLFTLLNLVCGCIAIVFILQNGEQIVLLGNDGITNVNYFPAITPQSTNTSQIPLSTVYQRFGPNVTSLSFLSLELSQKDRVTTHKPMASNSIIMPNLFSGDKTAPSIRG